MPRKYHRPPDTTTKRRKPRKTAIPYEFEAPDEIADGFAENAPEGESVRPSRKAAVMPDPMRAGIAVKGERHVTVDYSYVRGEVVRIVAIIGFLVIALIITSIFR